MAAVLLLHSVYGLRPAMHTVAARLRGAGHEVAVPDLYAGRAAATIDEGFELVEQTGWTTVMERARAAARELPEDAVIMGLSMGAGVAGDLLAERPRTGGLLLWHAFGGAPAALRPGLPVQVHVADPDERFAAADQLAAWIQAMGVAGATVEVWRYPGAPHFYTEPDLPEYDAVAAELTWERSLAFLAQLAQ